ncbi:MAG: hypothetical protein KAJ51_01645, partial [Thermoplasmata archaeon]|nr:hypothetical protein [Thermoplasmata archaeon]
SGSPTLAHVGWYWVNVTVGDGEGGFDSHNFTLTVYATANQPPDITTEDDINAVVGEIYTVDYEATDDRTPIDYLHWSLKTNASWLTMHTNTGVLSGTPGPGDVGWYIVNVSVFDGEDGWDYHNFVLTVSTEPIKENNAPELSDPTLTPSEGDVETEFTFTIHYYDEDGDEPTLIEVNIDGQSHKMNLKYGNESDGVYEFKIKLTAGNHTYYFTASDGIDTVSTDTYNTPKISVISDGKEIKSSWDWLIWVIVIVIVIVVIIMVLFIFMRKKKLEEPTEEERLPEEPPPTPEVEPEQPIEEASPEVPPEEPPIPELPAEQPSTPEVTLEPQVEAQAAEQPPQPAPMPQLEEQPTPQGEQPQPQVEAQEPAVEQPAELQAMREKGAEPEQQKQAPVPRVNTEP